MLKKLAKSIHSNSELWRGELSCVILSAHHLGLMYQDIHLVQFEVAKEFSEGCTLCVLTLCMLLWSRNQRIKFIL